MGVTVGRGDLYHLLEAGDACGEQQVVVAVPEEAGVDTVHSAAEAALLEDVEEVLAIETVGSSRQNLALTDAIGDGKARRNLTVVADIAELVDVDIYDEPEKHKTDNHHISKEDGKFTEIKAF